MFISVHHSLPSKGKKKLIVIHQCSPTHPLSGPLPPTIPFTMSYLRRTGIQGLSFNEVILSGRKRKKSPPGHVKMSAFLTLLSWEGKNTVLLMASYRIKNTVLQNVTTYHFRRPVKLRAIMVVEKSYLRFCGIKMK